MSDSIYSSAFLNGRNFNSSFAPSPYVDLAASRAPSDLKRMFPLFEYYAKMDDVTSPAVQKVSEYPVMPIDYSRISQSEKRDYIRHIMEDVMDTRGNIISLNLDHFVYGSSFISIAFPFKRWFECKKCKHKIFSEFVNSYTYHSGKFKFKCQKCGDADTAKEYGDFYYKDKERVRYLRWRPHDIDVIVHPFTGEERIYYTPPKEIIKQVRSGHKFIIDGTPKIILEAIQANEKVLLGEDDVFHMKRGSVSSTRELAGWGTSLFLPCIGTGYVKKVLQKATEVAGVIRSAPAQVLFPETNNAAGPHGNILMAGNMADFQDHMKRELERHRKDPGYIMIAPHPVGQQAIFGDSKNFNYFQEISYQNEQLLSAIGFPREILQGGLQYSSSSIALRILEVQLHKVAQQDTKFLQWAYNRLSHVFSFSNETIFMKPFRVADDIQLLQIQLQESSNGNLSRRRIWEGVLNIDWDKEMQMIEEEDDMKTKSLKKRSTTDMQIKIDSEEMYNKAMARAQVALQLEQFREQAKLMKKDPSYATVLRQQQSIQQQQMMAAQQQAMMAQADALERNAESKQKQQDRLQEKYNENTNEKGKDSNLDQIETIVTSVLERKVDVETALNSVFKKDIELYKSVIRSLISRPLQKKNESLILEIYNHVKSNAPEILNENPAGVTDGQ